MKKLFALLLSFAIVLTSSSVVAFAAVDLGTEKADGVFDIVLSSSGCYGDTATVTATVKNITAEPGLSGVEFILKYDNTKLVLTNDLNEDNENILDCITAMPKNWENLTNVTHTVSGGIATATNDGEVHIAVVTEYTSGHASADGDIVLTFTFDVVEGTTDALDVYVTHSDVLFGFVNTPTSYTVVQGNGSAVSLVKHSFTDYVEDDNATCQKNETETAVCDNGCGETDSREIADSKVGHKYTDYVADDNATCQKNETETASCDFGCGETDTRDVADSVVGHKYTNYVYNDDAECGVDGTKTAECDFGCGTEDTVTAEGTALTHKYTNYVYNNDAECGVDGTKTAECDHGCGTEDTVTAEGTALTHKYTNYVSDGNATCKADGTKTASCDNGCGTKDTVADVGSKDSVEHTPGEWEVTDHSRVQSCTVCNEVIDEAYLIGDVNRDGNIDALDYAILKRAVLGSIILDDEQKKLGDINRDGSIDALDYAALKRAVLGSYEIDQSF